MSAIARGASNRGGNSNSRGASDSRGARYSTAGVPATAGAPVTGVAPATAVAPPTIVAPSVAGTPETVGVSATENLTVARSSTMTPGTAVMRVNADTPKCEDILNKIFQLMCRTLICFTLICRALSVRRRSSGIGAADRRQRGGGQIGNVQLFEPGKSSQSRTCPGSALRRLLCNGKYQSHVSTSPNNCTLSLKMPLFKHSEVRFLSSFAGLELSIPKKYPDSRKN
jgi:hypothetical protein